MNRATYSGLRGWLTKLRRYEEDLFERPGDPPFPYVPETHRSCRYGRPPFKPGEWIEVVFRPHSQAMDDLVQLSIGHPELARQIRDALDGAEAAYCDFAKASTVLAPSVSVMLEAYPANDADRAWWHLQDPIGNLRRRLTAAVRELDELKLTENTSGDRLPPALIEQPVSEQALTDNEVRVLQALAETPDKTVVQCVICARTDLSRRTVVRILKRLAVTGLVTQPRGVRGGWTITQAGQEKIAH